ncbi:hypothetical protein L4C36_10240, partial [Photobacterium japonica]
MRTCTLGLRGFLASLSTCNTPRHARWRRASLWGLCTAVLATSGLTIPLTSHAENAQYAAIIDTRDHIDGRMVLGRTERVFFPDIDGLKGVGMSAKIDTGADSTSLHAEKIHLTSTDPRFKGLTGDALINAIAEAYDALNSTQLRDRKDKNDIIVHFELIHPYTGKHYTLQRPLLRLAMIKSRDDGHLARPVVELNLTIG